MNQYRIKLKDKWVKREIDLDTGEYKYSLLSSPPDSDKPPEDSTVYFTRPLASKDIDNYREWYNKQWPLFTEIEVPRSVFEIVEERMSYKVTPMSEIRYRGGGK